MITISVIAALATFSTSGHAQILKGRVVLIRPENQHWYYKNGRLL